MTLALAAAKKGLSSHVIDRADPAELTAEGFDERHPRVMHHVRVAGTEPVVS